MTASVVAFTIPHDMKSDSWRSSCRPRSVVVAVAPARATVTVEAGVTVVASLLRSEAEAGARAADESGARANVPAVGERGPMAARSVEHAAGTAVAKRKRHAKDTGKDRAAAPGVQMAQAARLPVRLILTRAPRRLWMMLHERLAKSRKP